jgi:hypothetical protein
VFIDSLLLSNAATVKMIAGSSTPTLIALEEPSADLMYNLNEVTIEDKPISQNVFTPNPHPPHPSAINVPPPDPMAVHPSVPPKSTTQTPSLKVVGP